jgi:hypothetical protein
VEAGDALLVQLSIVNYSAFLARTLFAKGGVGLQRLFLKFVNVVMVCTIGSEKACRRRPALWPAVFHRD